MPTRVIYSMLLILCASLICGCDDGRLQVVPVRGTVTCQGEPVPAGMIVFSPIVEDGAIDAARPALGLINSDGTFVLKTYEAGDGALIGKHRVTYTPPPSGDEGREGDEEGAGAVRQEPLPKDHPCRFGGTVQADVEVVDGENDLTIELSPTRPGREADDDSDSD